MRIALVMLAGAWPALVATARSDEAPSPGLEGASAARSGLHRNVGVASPELTPQFRYQAGQAPRGNPGLEEGESWVFRPARDPFSAAALWNLSLLNETSAGAHGFIGLSPDGNSFVRGDGQPIRFWGGSTYVQTIARQTKDQRPLIYHARFPP